MSTMRPWAAPTGANPFRDFAQESQQVGGCCCWRRQKGRGGVYYLLICSAFGDGVFDR